MPIYITQGRYTTDALKGMTSNPENREKAVADLMTRAGGKLVALYFTFGEYDFLSIVEAPNEAVMASALIAGAASGGVTHLKTSIAMATNDAMNAFRSAGELRKSFKPAGGPARALE
ncbi:GYD domain-containing protein [Methylocapsa acidiphila]|uniref:GYD domain-containing protein n=1 Tax=Methylocapsa acidiphila TaxID=133552 RepID=UPI00040C6F80|nr:GYD domain-containing protein [Methylocapsa acidiphila]